MVDIARVTSVTGRMLSHPAPLESRGCFRPEADVERLANPRGRGTVGLTELLVDRLRAGGHLKRAK